MLTRILGAISLIVLGFILNVPSVSAASGVWAKTGNNVGTANVGWSNRGGSCHIAYTEAGQTVDKYHTVANCDQASLEIGHLTPGVKYAFRVMEDGGVWSGRVYAVAAGAARAQATTQVARTTAAAAPQHRESVAESLPKDEYPVHYYKDCNRQGSMMTNGRLNDDERATGKCGTGATNFRTVSGKNSGEITIHWSDNTIGAQDYHLVYGTESGHYTMGALNIGGHGQSYTVRYLNPGQRYYFKLIPVKNGEAVGSTWEVSDVAR